MMKVKTKEMYVCQECGHQSARWLGRCPSCESWNTFAAENVSQSFSVSKRSEETIEKPQLIQDVTSLRENRLKTGIREFDRVIGGGVITGSVTLIGGDPGIGKSTLTLQVVHGLAGLGLKILYVSGEESLQQTKMRADRIGVREKSSFYIANQVDLHLIEEQIQQIQPDVVVIDSIQVVFSQEVASSPGSVTQVRECAAVLTQLAKSRGTALILIGHVTKEGVLAGPRVLEHLVDTVLYFEGERYTSYRLLRTVKNRFGSTNELGVFEMTSQGLAEVSNPSEIFLAERPKDAAGSVVVPIIEGTRPFLVEIQGLVSRSSFGVVRQKAQGFDANRLALLVAVLEKKLGLNLQDKDIFVNVVGGVKVFDPAADLAVALATASALSDRPVPYDTVVLGEIGLSAEVRSVSQLSLRINEAERLGFKRCILPRHNLKSREDIRSGTIELIPVETVREALKKIYP